jgi:hypothetical protein
MKMKAWNKARECAKNVIADSQANYTNKLYNMALWGNAMRNHMAYIKKEGLEASVKPDVARLVAKAEAVLVAQCDGKDCSFKTA